MSTVAHDGQRLLLKLSKVLNGKPIGLALGASLRQAAIIIDTHIANGNFVDIAAVHAELDELLSTFRLLRQNATVDKAALN